MKKQKNPVKNGFTLVEVLVTLALAGIILLSLHQVTTSYLHVAQRGRYLNLANAYIEAKVETLRNQGYNSISSGTTSLTSELPTALPPSRSASMTVTTPSTGVKQIDLTISYKDQGINQSFSYTTYIGELGVGQ